MAAVIRDLGLQTDLPRIPLPPQWHLPLPDWLVWVAIIVAVIVLLITFRDYLPFLRAGGAAWEGVPDGLPATPGAVSPRGAVAADLARQGRFVEAMHETLLEALEAIRARLGERLADSLTSREILRAAAIPDPGRAALRDVIGRVEWTYFGEYPAVEADYLACRDSLAALLGVLGGMAAA